MDSRGVSAARDRLLDRMTASQAHPAPSRQDLAALAKDMPRRIREEVNAARARMKANLKTNEDRGRAGRLLVALAADVEEATRACVELLAEPRE